MTGLDNARYHVEVDNALVCCHVAKEDPSEVMLIELGALGALHASLFYAHTGTKGLEVGNIRLAAVPAFEWCFACGGVDATIMEVGIMEEGSGPELGRETRAVK